MTNLIKMSEAASLGLHAMAYLAARKDNDPVKVTDMARELKASANHLSKVFQTLAQHGLVISTRGPKGGFSLAAPADTINLLTVFEIFEGPLKRANCLLSERICRSNGCILGGLVNEVGAAMAKHLTETTLADMAYVFKGGNNGDSQNN